VVREGIGNGFSRWPISLVPILILQAPAWSVPGSSLAYIPPDHWPYRAFFRLASLGLLPFSTGLAKPINRLGAGRVAHGEALTLRTPDSLAAPWEKASPRSPPDPPTPPRSGDRKRCCA
jgi:hypothetical protein